MNRTRRLLSLLLISLLLCNLLTGCQNEQSPETPTEEETTEEKTYTHRIVDTSKALYSYEEMNEDLTLLAEAYPSLLTVESIGTTLDNREIPCAVFGSKSAEKQIILHAGIHAREYMTSLLVMAQLEYYLAVYEVAEYEGESLSALLSQYCFYIVPMANPDGIAISQYGSNALKSEKLRTGLKKIYESDASLGFATTSEGKVMDFETYLRYWKANARGVDLNRNYNANWESYNAILAPCFRNYKGIAPGSEPETAAMTSLTDSLDHPVAVVSMHAQGNILYWNCGQKDPEPSRSLAAAISKLTGYRIIEEVHQDASYNDWVILKRNLPSVTVEIGKNGCPLDISEFPNAYRECRDLLPMLAAFYSDGIEKDA